MNPKHFIITLLALFASMTASAYNTWTDSNGTEWAFDINGSNATITNRGYINSAYVPAISGTIPADLTIPTTVYVGENPYTVTSIGGSVFSGCSSVTSINIPDGVTYIGSYAFSGCYSVTSINIPNSVTSIESWAFNNCNGLTSINIPDGVTSIADCTFRDCSSLTSINIPDGVTSIGQYAFSGCYSLTSINIPNSVTSIGNSVFAGCSRLTSLTIPNGVTSIGQYVFNNCSRLTSITIPNSVTSIVDHMFQGCSKLTSINIPEGVTSIGISAFSGCSSLTSITIPNSVTSIGYQAFWGCTGLTSITIPASVESLGQNAFGSHFMIVTFNSSTPCTQSGLGEVVRLVVPHAYVDAYREAWSALVNVIVDADHIEKTVNVTANESSSAVAEAIGEDVLKNVLHLKVAGTFNSYDVMVIRNKMINLMDLDLSDANVVASSYAYYNTYKTKDNIITGYFLPRRVLSFKFPKNITALEDNAFFACSNLKTLTLPEGITSIGSYTFYQCSGLPSITIPDGVTSIGSYAFYQCSSLTSITLPDDVTSIGSNAFQKCPSLTDIHLPEQLRTISNYAFGECSALTEIHLPPYLTSIGNNAFSSCSNLKTIYAYMPDIISIGTSTFNDYTHQQLYVPEFLYNKYYYDTNWSQFVNVNKTTLSPDDYTKVPTNSDIIWAENDQRIPDMSNGEHVDGEINTQGSFTVEGDEPQAFNEVEQILDGEGQGGSLIGEDDGVTEGNLTVNNLRVKINVKAGRWYFFCFPFDVTIANCEYPGQYAWRYYDGAYRASNGSGGWKPVTGETLTALEGYAFQTSHTGNLIISFNHPTFGGNRPKPLNSYTSGNAANASWNLVGNPYSSFYDFLDDTFLSPITVYNSSTGSYQAYRPGDDECHLQPYEAFFVQKPVGVDLINFTPDNRESYNKGQEKKSTRAARRRARGIDPDRCLINLQIMSGEQETDRTRVVLNEQKSRDYELDCDASKFLSADAQAQLYTIENGTQMAINERPLAGDIRLGYTAKKAGTLSISAPRMDLPMMLVDTKLGITFDLSVGTYDFETQAGTFNDRFMLCLSGEATAIKTMKEKTGVLFGTQDGGIAIGGAEGKTVSIYTTGGAMAAQHSGNGFIALKSGVYVVNVDGVTAKVSVK